MGGADRWMVTSFINCKPRGMNTRYVFGIHPMTTHEFVYQTFVIYVFVKALILAPLAWMTFMFWWSERSKSLPSGE